MPGRRSGTTTAATRNASLLRAFRKRFGKVPFLQLLKIRVDEVRKGTVTVSMPVGREVRQYQGIAHGGALSALADTAATFAALAALPPGADVVTIEFKINYLEPVTRGRAIATGRVVRVGKRTAVVEATVTETGSRKPACVGLFTVAVFQPKAMNTKATA